MRFTKQVFVRVEVDGRTEFLTASEDQTDGIAAGESCDVATYQLVEVNRVTWEPKVTATPRRRK